MEPRDGRKLLRTMSFISSRAKALRQRFVPSQRSLSDTWQDHTTEAFLNDDPHMPSPDLGGSMLSLLDEPDTLWQREDTKTSNFKAQRSKSLDSLNSFPANMHSPPGVLPFQMPSTPILKPTISSNATIPRPQIYTMNSMQIPKISGPLLSNEQPFSSFISSRFPDIPIPKIPAPPSSPLRVSAPTTPRQFESLSLFSHQFTEYSRPSSVTGLNLSPCSLAPSTPKSNESIVPCHQTLTETPRIPKIPGPPPSPKHSRPSTPKTIDNFFSDNSSMFMLPISPGFSHPSSPKHFEHTLLGSPIIPKIPGPPPSPKHSRPTTPRHISTSFLNTNSLSSNPYPLGFPTLSPKDLEQQCKQTIACGDLALHDTSFTHQNRLFTQQVEKSVCSNPTTIFKDLNPLISIKVVNQHPIFLEKNTSSSSSKTTPLSNTSGPETESFDNDENRDTISEGPTRPTLFDLRPRPKLKHQWSMDDSRTTAAGSTCTRQMSEISSTVNSVALKPAEKRRRFFMRKQTNSAPDSFDSPTHVSVKTKEHHSVSFCLGNVRKCRGSDSSIIPPTVPTIQLEPDLEVEHLADLRYPDADPPCHFCCQQTSTSIHDENRLKIVSGGLVRSRDGSRDESGTHYMNLPSPNVQNEADQPTTFHRHSHGEEAEELKERLKEDGEGEEHAPPASALTRRRALVPPKLMAEGVEDRKHSGSSECSTPRARRSSIVVIPPMQICPGDLLVYSKVLTQRNNLVDMDGSTTSLAISDTDGVNSRKGKNTWSLLRLFERSNRGKSGSLCGLEEVLSCLQRVDFNDDQLSRFRGMSWPEFVAHVDSKRNGTKEDDGETSSSSSDSSPPSPIHPSTPPPQPSPPRQHTCLKGKLVRAQSERCFERRLTGARAIWRIDRTLPLRPSPLVPTLSEKDLLVSPVSTTSRAECKRREAVWDLFQSECAFLYDHLMVLKNVFMEPLKKIQVEGYAMFAEPELLFGNLDELSCVTYAFCKEFIKLLLENVNGNGDLPTIDVLVKLFQKSSEANSVSQAYHCYALNYINALNYLETLRRHVEFCEFEKWCNRDPRCKKLQLTDLLVAPVQHIMKVPLILKEVESRTEEPSERELITQILEVEENSIRELDDKMKWLKNFERLLEIQRNIVWPSVFELDPKIYVPEFLKPALTRQPCDRIIVSPRRQIINEGLLQIWDSGKPQEMYVVLFDDMLLLTRRKKGLSKKKSSLSENWASSCSRGSTSSNETSMRYVVYKQPLSLDRFFIHDVSVVESASCRLESAFVLVSLNRFQQVVTIHTFQAPSDQAKQTWLFKLRDTQEKWKRTLQHTVFRSSPRPSTCSVGHKTAI